MPADHELPKWEQLAKSVTDDPLKQARDVANKWVTILSALVGLSTVFGLVQGRDALSKLSPVFQFILVLAFVLTLAVSVRAIYLAALASEGSSGAVPLDKDNFIAWYTKSLIEALNQITQSRRMALLAVALLAIALGISWFAPGQQAPGTSVLVVQKSGIVQCGTLQKDNNGNLVLTRNGQQPELLKNVVSINIVSGCP